MQARLLALLLSIPLLTSGAAGVVLHVCQSMGAVSISDCDCEKEAGHADHEGHGEHANHSAEKPAAKLQAQPCCTVELSNGAKLLATQKAPSLRVDQATVALVGLGSSSVPRSNQLCELGFFRERAPPNIHGPPLFVRNCSFLN